MGDTSIFFHEKLNNHDYGRKGRKGMSPFILSRFFYGVSPCVSCELQGRSALHNACAAGQTEAGWRISQLKKFP